MSPSKSAVAFLISLAILAAAASAQQPAAADPSTTLNNLEQTARNSVGDLSHLRVEKWKADGNTKKNAQTDSESLQRNMSSALPELIAKVRTNPQDLNANFKLYRNLNVLYEVFARFAETTGAFGNRDDFDTLSKDLDGIDAARHAIGDRLDTLTTSVQSQLNQAVARARAAQAAEAAAPPKKIVIDDTEPEKKSTKKKKTTKPADSKTDNSSNGSTPK